jgi:hypothetical protein
MYCPPISASELLGVHSTDVVPSTLVFLSMIKAPFCNVSEQCAPFRSASDFLVDANVPWWKAVHVDTCRIPVEI